MAYNKIILEGHLTRDIEIRYGQSGNAIANTGMAVSKKFKKQDGSQGEKVLFVDLTFYSRSAEIANQYLRKGSHILVDGELRLDSWDDKTTGAKRSKHSIDVREMQMLGTKSDTQQAPQQNNYSQPAPQAQPSQPAPSSVPEIDINIDEIPF